uniref:Uncharacterized protein n=1 Tax=Sphaerodactylus townsendi TaxID=933632 RepID=A0ACB8ECZ7_9SAUR
MSRETVLLPGFLSGRLFKTRALNTGSSDPYCIVKIDNEAIIRTATVWKTLFPFWSEEYEVHLPPTFHCVSFYVMDEDALSRDDVIGKVSLTHSLLAEHPKGAFGCSGFAWKDRNEPPTPLSELAITARTQGDFLVIKKVLLSKMERGFLKFDLDVSAPEKLQGRVRFGIGTLSVRTTLWEVERCHLKMLFLYFAHKQPYSRIHQYNFTLRLAADFGGISHVKERQPGCLAPQLTLLGMRWGSHPVTTSHWVQLLCQEVKGCPGQKRAHLITLIDDTNFHC